jgi:hypothetical protein
VKRSGTRGLHDVLRLADNEILASSTLNQAVEQLHQLSQAGEATAIIVMLDELIPGATIRAAPQPEITAIM